MVPSNDRRARSDLQTSASQNSHVVGVFRPQVDDDGHPDAPADHQQEIRHLGRDAGRRALAGSVVMGVGVALIVGLIIMFGTDLDAAVTVGIALAAGAFAGAIGGLWGAFSRLGTGDDWREAVTRSDPPPRVVEADTGRPTTEPVEAEVLEERGAAEIHVAETDPTALPGQQAPGRSERS